MLIVIFFWKDNGFQERILTQRNNASTLRENAENKNVLPFLSAAPFLMGGGVDSVGQLASKLSQGVDHVGQLANSISGAFNSQPARRRPTKGGPVLAVALKYDKSRQAILDTHRSIDVDSDSDSDAEGVAGIDSRRCEPSSSCRGSPNPPHTCSGSAVARSQLFTAETDGDQNFTRSALDPDLSRALSRISQWPSPPSLTTHSAASTPLATVVSQDTTQLAPHGFESAHPPRPVAADKRHGASLDSQTPARRGLPTGPATAAHAATALAADVDWLDRVPAATSPTSAAAALAREAADDNDRVPRVLYEAALEELVAARRALDSSQAEIADLRATMPRSTAAKGGAATARPDADRLVASLQLLRAAVHDELAALAAVADNAFQAAERCAAPPASVPERAPSPAAPAAASPSDDGSKSEAAGSGREWWQDLSGSPGGECGPGRGPGSPRPVRLAGTMV